VTGRFCVDADVFITSWNRDYPQNIFPSLWREIAKHQEDIILIKPIYEQIDPVSESDRNKTDAQKREKYPLRMWLQQQGFAATPVDDETEQCSLELEQTYQTDNGSKGADQNDIKLIAYGY